MLPFPQDFVAAIWLHCNADGPCSVRILSPSGCILAYTLWISGEDLNLLPAFLVNATGPIEAAEADPASLPYLQKGPDIIQ